MKNIKYYIPGILLILLALLITAMPEIIVALMAAFIIMAGIFVLYLGHQMRKLDSADSIYVKTRFHDDYFDRKFYNMWNWRIW